MFYLEGLAEGVTGVSVVQASSLDEVFDTFPALAEIKSKLTVKGKRITAFCACDG